MVSRFLEFLNTVFEKVPALSVRFRWLILFLYLCSTAFMLHSVITRFDMDMSLETMFPDDHPVRTTLNNFRHAFGSDDGLYIVYEAKDGDVFSEKSIETIARLHKELDDARVARGEHANELTRIEKIDSLYNVRLQKVEGDTLISQNLLATDFPGNNEEREAKRQIALEQDSFRLAYFSDDFRYGGIRIKTDFGTIPVGSEDNTISNVAGEVDLLEDEFADADLMDDIGELSFDTSLSREKIEYKKTQMDEYLYFMSDIRAITEKPEYQHFEFHYSGNASFMEFAFKTFEQGSLLMGLMVAVFIILLWVLFHSFSGVLWPITVILTSTVWSIGFFSLLGVTMSNIVVLTVMLIMAVGVAACVHILSTYGLYRNEGKNHQQAMAISYRQTGVPIFLTSITTIAGMTSLVVSDIPQITVFGLSSAFGVFVAFFMIMFVLPIFLDFWHPYRHEKEKLPDDFDQDEDQVNWLRPYLEKLPDFVEKNALPIVSVFVIAFLIFSYGTLMVKVDTNITESTREGSAIRAAAKIIDSNMMGGQNMEVVLDFKTANAVKDPEVLKAIESFQNHILEAYPEFMVKSFSIADYVKDTNKAMNEDRNEFWVIPDDARMAAQLLYMFNNSNAEDRRTLVSDDYSVTHITIQLRNAGSYEYADMFISIDEDLERIFGPLNSKYANAENYSTGTLPLMMKMVDRMSWAQIKSFGLAIIIISVFLIVSLNSFVGGAISMLPNVLPSISTFGLMGLLGMSLNTDVLIIAPLIIGIAVDDTIHFMAHYRDAWFRTGDMRESLKETIFEVGQAVTFTTIILATGFAVLSFSDFLGIAKTGAFGSLAILVALLCDLFLLPASIVLFKPDLGREKHLKSLANNQQLKTA